MNANNKYLKRIMLLFMLALICFGCISGCDSKSKDIIVPEVKPDTYVYDEGNIISNDVNKNINALLDTLESKTTAEVVVVTVPDLNGYSIESYANKLFNTLKIGKKSEDNGVLLLISRDDKRVRLEIGRGFESLITDSISGRILDTYFVPSREIGDYDKAVDETIKVVCKYIADDKNVMIAGLSSETLVSFAEEKESDDFSYLILLLIIVFVIIVVYVVISDDSGTGSGGGYSSGGFGGFSGGGSFGGGSFGGGFSGGGGASR